jgi:hypothetical protein
LALLPDERLKTIHKRIRVGIEPQNADADGEEWLEFLRLQRREYISRRVFRHRVVDPEDEWRRIIDLRIQRVAVMKRQTVMRIDSDVQANQFSDGSRGLQRHPIPGRLFTECAGRAQENVETVLLSQTDTREQQPRRTHQPCPLEHPASSHKWWNSAILNI